jgi:NAD-dependent deacetylase
MVESQLSAIALFRLVNSIRHARHIVVLTGAGVSAESGIPTFRDALTGLWAHFDAERLATKNAFREDPARVWGWYEWRRMMVMRNQPNPAHRSIAALARHTPRLTVITQNVDNLHERAGSTDVLHLHGSLFKPRCFACARPHALAADIPDEPEDGRALEPPRCSHCRGRVRPGVVWFGEPLPCTEWQAALATVAQEECDVFISIGTSSLVYPAAELPLKAHRRGAVVVQINAAPTPLDEFADYSLRGPAGKLLPQLLKFAWEQTDF